MTDNSSNQRPMFTNMKEGSAESNIFAGYPVPLQFYPPQTPFMYPFSVLPNMWLPNVDDLVMGQRVSELGPSFVGLPSAVIGQIDCDHMTRVTPLRKESVIVTAKPGGGVVPITLNPNVSATCINGNMQGGFSVQEKGNDCISRNRAESDEATANLVTGQNAVESLTPKQRYSRSDTGQSAQGFAELDVAQILVNDMPVPFLSQSKADSTTAQEHTFVKTPSPTLPLPVMEREESMPLAIAQETFVNDSDSHSHLNFQQEQGTKSTENNVFINEDVDKSCSPSSPKETVLSDSTNLCLEDTVPVVQQDEPDEDNSTVEVAMIPNTANLLEEEIYDNYQESILVNKPGSSSNDDDVKSNQEMSDARYDDDLDHNEIDTDDCEKNKDSNENVADQENKSSLKQTQSDTNGIIADVDSACSHNTSVSAVSESHLLVTESGNREEAAEVTDLEMNIINDRDNNGSSSNDEEMKETNEKPMEECQEVACTSKMAYKCEVCCQLFRSPVGLQKHLEFHTDKVQHHTCTTCFERFDSVASLEEHGKTHQKKRPHKCGFCPKAFRDPGSLQKHVRVHTGEKPYKCTSCFRSFAEYSSLRKHLRVHTGEQPYKCTFCSKAFSISGNLQRHILIHTGERPYKCTFCPKAFNNPSHLRRHVKNLHYKSEGKGCHLFGGKELNLDAMTDGDIKDSSGSAMNGSAVSMDSEPVTPSDDGVPTHVDMLLNQVSESVSK